MTNARATVADFWDEWFSRWLAGEDYEPEPLPRWRASYDGRGHGEVMSDFGVEPYTGDLRGETSEPRLVILGLNPGVAHAAMQGRSPQGAWMERIASSSHSRVLNRIPFGDDAWRGEHNGRDSAYWIRLMKFARSWVGDESLQPHEILNMDLYPWHSRGINGSNMRVPSDIVDSFIWQPISEVQVPHVFAFGIDWNRASDALQLPEVARYRPEDLSHRVEGGWNVSIRELPSGQRAVVSWQQGYSGPPGPARMVEFRRIVISH